MATPNLPDRASLEFLRKLAKERLRELRRDDSDAKLASALLAVAREHGFPSWRALKAEVDRRNSDQTSHFISACSTGDISSLRTLLASDPDLIRATDPLAPHTGWTVLHAAARAGHADAVRILLEHGTEVNAREAGDNTTPLHWAAAHASLDAVRALVDGGADIHGFGDVHALDVIGWAAYFRPPGGESEQIEPSRNDVIALLLDHGARHHVFSAICMGDLDLIQQVVEDDSATLDRRMSRFERGQSPLHFALSRKRYDILELLIALGADLEAEDVGGQTALAVAMLRGDGEASRLLHAAGAKQPAVTPSGDTAAMMASLSESVRKCVPMIMVPDVAAALEWYTSIGFKELARYGDDGEVNFGMVALGDAELMLNMHGHAGRQSASLWFYTDQVDDMYRVLKSAQLAAAQAEMKGEGAKAGVEFVQDIEDMFYGAREFGIRDLNGFELYFIQVKDS